MQFCWCQAYSSEKREVPQYYNLPEWPARYYRSGTAPALLQLRSACNYALRYIAELLRAFPLRCALFLKSRAIRSSWRRPVRPRYRWLSNFYLLFFCLLSLDLSFLPKIFYNISFRSCIISYQNLCFSENHFLIGFRWHKEKSLLCRRTAIFSLYRSAFSW